MIEEGKSALILFALLGWFMPVNLYAQRCEEAPSKKIIKLMEKGLDQKNYDIHRRIAFLKQATEEDPQFASAWYALGNAYVILAQTEGNGYLTAEKYFLSTIEICPFYNARVYYLLGKIAFSKKLYAQCNDYLQVYLKHEDAKDEKELSEAEKIKPLAAFLADTYANPVPFSPQSVSAINTYEDEFLPMLTPDNSMLYYTRRYTKQGRNELTPRQVEEFHCSAREGDMFKPPIALAAPFNVPGEGYGGVTFALSNQQLILTICKQNKYGKVNCDLYGSTMKDGVWSAFVNLGDSVNTADGWESQPTLSGDGKSLYFASAREGSKGMDIYYSSKKEDGKWSKAKRLGPEINTDKNEKSPFIHSDSRTLYFSSDGHIGLGGYDIFYVKTDTSGVFRKPVNLGYPINTAEDEAGFFVSLDGKKGYFSSSKLRGKGVGGWDVFSFDLYPEARPEKVLLLKGTLAADAVPLSKTHIEIKGVKSKKITRIEVDSLTGGYSGIYTLEKNEDAVVSFMAPDAAFSSRLVKSTELDADPVIHAETKTLEKVEQGKAFRMDNISYAVNASELLQESKYVLDAFADYLQGQPGLQVEIRGHTDNRGNPADNLALSTDRAFAVYSYLLTKGISNKQISFKGFGDKAPLGTNETEEGRNRNRRTEFYILPH